MSIHGLGASRRQFLAGAGAMTAGSLLSFSPARAQEKTLTLQLGWLASNGILGEVCAEKLGYFKDAGLGFDIVAGGPNVDGVASVVAGRANLGQLSSSPALMMARAAGIPVKCIAAGYQQHPFTYFSLSDNPVNEPADLVGKRVATQATARILLDALLAYNNISPDDVEVAVMGADMAQLMNGQVDVVTGWDTNVNALSILGDKRVNMSLWDAGIQLYANPYYTTDDTLENDMDLLVAGMSAIAKGWGWAKENPEEATAYLVERFPNLDAESEAVAVPMVLDYSFNAKTAEKGWGTMEMENWKAQLEIYTELNQFPDGAPTLEDIVTLDVLEATADARPKMG